MCHDVTIIMLMKWFFFFLERPSVSILLIRIAKMCPPQHIDSAIKLGNSVNITHFRASTSTQSCSMIKDSKETQTNTRAKEKRKRKKSTTTWTTNRTESILRMNTQTMSMITQEQFQCWKSSIELNQQRPTRSVFFDSIHDYVQQNEHWKTCRNREREREKWKFELNFLFLFRVSLNGRTSSNV